MRQFKGLKLDEDVIEAAELHIKTERAKFSDTDNIRKLIERALADYFFNQLTAKVGTTTKALLTKDGRPVKGICIVYCEFIRNNEKPLAGPKRLNDGYLKRRQKMLKEYGYILTEKERKALSSYL